MWKSETFLLIIFTWICFFIYQSSQCDTSISQNTDRSGDDYTSYVSVNNISSDCYLACCNDTRCFSWAFVGQGVIGNNKPLCFLKEWVPDQNPHQGVTSGVIQRDPTNPPVLPSMFRVVLGIQHTLSPYESWTGKCFYKYDEGKGVCYNSLPNNTLEIQLYRYDLKTYYLVKETALTNGTAEIVCTKSALSGSIFDPKVLASLSYKGESFVMGQSVSHFTGNILSVGIADWFTNLNTPPTVERVFRGYYIYDVIEFDGDSYFSDSVFDDPISLCNGRYAKI